LKPAKTASRPSASKIGTPIYHRRRRDWQDDRSLILELFKIVSQDSKLYSSADSAVLEFLNEVNSIEKSGFEANANAFLLGVLLRESIQDLNKKQGHYNLKIHAIKLPANLTSALQRVEKKLTKSGLKSKPDIRLSDLFPDPEIRGFALERMHILHRSDLTSYLNSLILKERNSLLGYSATIKDLIHISEHKIKHRKLISQNKFTTDETDIWIPELRLGIEVRNSWEDCQLNDLLFILKNTLKLKCAKYLAIVCPDDLSDKTFHSLREIERQQQIDSLSIIRIGDLGNYLDQLIKITSSEDV
jgi:hypothetical protein